MKFRLGNNSEMTRLLRCYGNLLQPMLVQNSNTSILRFRCDTLLQKHLKSLVVYETSGKQPYEFEVRDVNLSITIALKNFATISMKDFGENPKTIPEPLCPLFNRMVGVLFEL